jgi:hypothetical protein
MNFSLRFVLTSLVASTLLVPASALADDNGEKKEESTAEDPSKGLKGFELMLRPSFGGAASDSPVKLAPSADVAFQTLMKGGSRWGTGFVGQASVGYRFVPFLSAGLRAGFRSASRSSVDDSSTNLSRTGENGGLYVRFYPAVFAPSVSKYIDPWVSAGIGYEHDNQSFRKDAPTGLSTSGMIPVTQLRVDMSIDHHAISVPLAIGVDYRVTTFLSLGPSFELAINNPIAGCITMSAPGFASETYCSNTQPGKGFVKAETYAVWNAGVDAKVTF